jgi:hypothetical protein
VRRAALALTVAVVGLAAMAEEAPAQPLLTGVTNIGEEVPLGFARTKATGARFVRIPLYWGGVAPKAQPAAWQPENPDDPHYHWDESDHAVADAVAAGLIPVLQVDGGPAWAQRCQAPDFARVNLCDTDPAALAAFAAAAARRYDGQGGRPRVQYWQALNEPNLSLFFNPQYAGDTPVSPDLYRELLNAFYRGVKSADASNLVIAAGLGPIAVPPYTIGPMRFARRLLCMHGHRHPRPNRGSCGAGVHLDIFAIQPYTTGGPTHEGQINDVQMGDLDKLQTLLRAADRAGRIEGAFERTPLWITEFSWDTAPPDPGGLPMGIATRWVAEALHQAWRAGVTHFFWYSLRDGPHDGRPYSESLESGLYFRGSSIEEDQPKEIVNAFRYPFVAYPIGKGLSFWGRTPDSLPHKVTIQVWKGRSWRRVAAVRAGNTGVFSGIARSRYGKDRRGTVRAVYPGQPSPPFSMKPVADFRQPPFG